MAETERTTGNAVAPDRFAVSVREPAITSSSSSPSIRVTDVGEYIRFHSCDRRFKLKFNDYQLAKALPFSELIFETLLDPVLQESGRLRESQWEESLRQNGFSDLTDYTQRSETTDTNHGSTPWTVFIQQLEGLPIGQAAYGREIRIESQLGAFQLRGQVDFAILWWQNDRPRLRLVECKASRKDRTYHRIQIALYGMMVRQLLEGTPVFLNGQALTPEDVECVVVRIDEATNQVQDILSQVPLDLATEEADLTGLLATDGTIARIVQNDLTTIDYQLDGRCNDCVFSVHCLAESGRERRLELLGLDPSTIRVLKAAGIETLDNLATLDLSSQQANAVRQTSGFSENLELLQAKAKTRRRTLPGGDLNPESYEVESLPHTGQGQLPEHTNNGERLIRIYLSIEYDYVENRLGALSAHITNSDGLLNTGFIRVDDGWQPDPVVCEQVQPPLGSGGSVGQQRPLQGLEVIKFKETPWTGDYVKDTAAEQRLIEEFLRELIQAIRQVAQANEAAIHFYVWSRQEITQLIEGCTRTSSVLLGHLQELLGCREGLEQLIYSSLQEEVDNRFALAWTGRDLAVVATLRWFGQRYHWCRQINGETVNLDHAFRQDIFDFKRELNFDSSGQWVPRSAKRSQKHTFEIRLRSQKSLSAPYWRAYWGTLPDPTDPQVDRRVAQAIERYSIAQQDGYLTEYLRARTHALRWIEERIRFKNPDLTKPRLDLTALEQFTLGVNTATRAAIDFLRLDQQVKITGWLANHLVPPLYRLPLGKTIPLRDIQVLNANQLVATIDLVAYGMNFEVFESNCTLGEGDFVRLTPGFNDPARGQTIRQLFSGGGNCIIDRIDPLSEQVVLSINKARSDNRYILYGKRDPNALTFANATLDESPSDFIAGKVESRLGLAATSYVNQWFDPQNPQIPGQAAPTTAELEQYQTFLDTLRFSENQGLALDQSTAVIAGLSTRIQLLQGPPGTGKTETTSVATFLRILAHCSVGDIVLISAPTHTAVDNLLKRLQERLPILTQHATSLGLAVPTIQLSRVDARDDSKQMFAGTNLTCFDSYNCTTQVNRMRSRTVLVVGGTINGILKMAQALNAGLVSTLILDEASMMVFSHFLALASLVRPDGAIMLAGDHRQLAPIVSHDWEQEDRPPVVSYQPFVSAYIGIQSLKQRSDLPDSAILCSALSYTFRLPAIIRTLIARLYRLDAIELEGRSLASTVDIDAEGTWERIWQNEPGLYLVLHDERQSSNSNRVETEIIKQLLESSSSLPANSVAIVTPHRAQRALLKTELSDYYGANNQPVTVIDTVERLQGGERPTVIVSATVSDPTVISKNVEFILDLNRSNVAFSRPKERLIVVCAKTLLEYIPAELEHYEETLLWKALRAICSQQIGYETINGHTVQIFTPPPASVAEATPEARL